MAASDPRKWLAQSDQTFPQEVGLDARKKSRKATSADMSTLVTGAESVHRSSRTTKGSGGQIAQLQNIEHIQTEQTTTSKASHASHLKMATANEPLNPLALAKSKPKLKPHVKMSSACASGDGQPVCTYDLAGPLLLLTTQLRMPLEPLPPPSPHGRKPFHPPKHQCLLTAPCPVCLSDIGQHYPSFLKGTFKAHFTPPVLPRFVLAHFTSNSPTWTWTTKDGPNKGRSFQVPTIPITCVKTAPKAVHWMVAVFHLFKAHLNPVAIHSDTGRVLPGWLRLYQNNIKGQEVNHLQKLWKEGHNKDQCWQEGSGRAGKAPKWLKGKKKGSEKAATAATTANTTAQSSTDAEPEGVWLAWVDDNQQSEVTKEDTAVLTDLDLNKEAFTKTYDHALLAGTSLSNHEEMILFDSGASRHMSSYCSQFLDYKPIIPQSVAAANNHTFLAIGKEIS
ncbi:hypothetical protein EDC04DRAFT_2908788 [Pisolithus marmoratus]|nr:hypothetical protein EDC04DRAFT_2908788 [Pisolithus marmoratus]